MRFICLFIYFLQEEEEELKWIKCECEYEPISLWTLIDWCTWCGLFCVIVRLFVSHIVIRDNLLKHLNFQHVSGSFSNCAVFAQTTFNSIFISLLASAYLFAFANLLKVRVCSIQFAFRFLWKLHFFRSFLSVINYHFPLTIQYQWRVCGGICKMLEMKMK